MPTEKNKKTVIFLMGPTASGKTQLALSLAEKLPVEIISVDSTQVYRGLDIGSAKPSPKELAIVPHHLIDIRDPSEPYSAAEFRRDALQAIESISERNKIPLLVGGSMLYFNVLLKGIADLPSADEKVRNHIEQEATELGWPAMHQKLAEIDPQTAARLHPNHSQRIARALEVFRVSGQSLSELHEQQEKQAENQLSQKYHLHQWAIAPSDREILHQRINLRFDQMIKQGFEKEVENLHKRGDLNESLPAIRSVGYRQMWAYLNGVYANDDCVLDDEGFNEVAFQTMVEKGKAATRQLAKKQFTWLRSWQQLQWFNSDPDDKGTVNFEQIREQALNTLQKGPI